MYAISHIRDTFRSRKKLDNKSPDGNYEIQCITFVANDDHIFGTPNKSYIEAEITWYELQSRNVNDLFQIYGKEVEIWKRVSGKNGWINSNYGWCIYSEENGSQYYNVLDKLWDNPDTRQAVMIYIRPSMHKDATEDDMSDFMCTTHVQYRLRRNRLDAYVYMRSNDAIFGFNNDVAWQRHVQEKLAQDLSYVSRYVKPGKLIWNAGSLHIYPQHFDLIQ